MRFYAFKMRMLIFKMLRHFFELFNISMFSKPGLNGLDDKLEKYLNYTNGFFIEAGGNDGFLQSNTYYLEKFKDWNGILIEGIPELYEKCKSERKNSKVYNYALVSNEFKESYVEMHFANLMSVVDGSMKSEEGQRKHIENGVQVQDLKQSYSVNVKSKTLESILDDLEKPVKIDFLSLDVEGYELEVLKGMNLKKYKPNYILVEARNFEEINDYLIQQYELVEQMTYHDYLYKLKSNDNR